MSFEDLGLSPEIVKAVTDAGYTTPTPIQAQAIPVVLMNRDVLGCAQTGTGKTAGFTLPMLDVLSAGRARARMPRSLILEPTRELAAQVSNSFETYGKYQKLSMALLIGGESFSDQEKKLDRGVDVLIATPGRLLDLIDRGKILLSDVKILVIDEADRMLDMGFIPDVERIVGFLPKNRQTLFFSATMPPEIRRLADAFLSNPKEISVAPPASPAETVVQAMIVVEEENKREALRRLIRSEDVKNAIIFCNRKKDVDILWKSLVKHGFDAVALHGDMAQAKRTETLEKFKNNEVRLLVASDVAARGLDVQGLSHVFNFDVPIHAEDYVHRIGRTGRAGRAGHSFTIATPDDGRFVQAITKLIGKDIPPTQVEGFDNLELSYEDRRRRRRGAKPTERKSEAKPRRERGERKERAAAKPREQAAETREEPRAERPRREHAPETREETRAERPRRDQAPEAREQSRAERPRRDQAPEAREQSRAERPRRERAPRTERPVAEPIRMMADNVARFPGPAERSRRGDRQHDDDDRRVVGFGDHLPAFLKRPVKVASGK